MKLLDVGKLPKNWKVASLVDDLPFVKTGVPEYVGEKKYYSTGSIKSHSLVEEGKYTFQNKPSRANRIVKIGDVLQARMKDTQKAIIINSQLDEQLFSTGFFQIRPTKEILNSKYIFYYFSSLSFNKVKDKLCSGSTQSALNDEAAKKIFVPIAPISEQQRIVYKIDELFSELDKGIEELEKTQQQLNIYRQAVLKWAFYGKLTNKEIVGNVMPEGWKIETLGNISQMCLGKMLDRQKNKGVLQSYLGNINVRWGKFEVDNLKQMPFLTSEFDRFSLRKGDLVICEGGEPGRCAIWNNDSSTVMIQKALHRVRVADNVDVKYMYYFIFLSAIDGTLKQYFTGTTIKHLTGTELKKIKLPLAPLFEQQKIVQEIESRLSICAKIEETITITLQQSEALRQSILKKAFEGKLV